MNRKNKKAFTLIELLVVIAIIGILATIAVVALQQARQSARDSKRIADIRQIQTALEMYYNNNSSYPDSITNNQIADSNKVYIEIFPTAPTPADGDCSSEANQYVYTVLGEENDSYTISFCLGGQTGGISSGVNCASPLGIVDVGCACGGKGSVTYHGYTYQIVAIGDQCWFAENLKYLPIGGIFSPAAEGSEVEPYYYVYDYNDEGNISDLTEDSLDMYSNYGVLYNWPASLGVCPPGWHLPSNNDWVDLVDYIVAETDAEASTVGRWLKSCRHVSGANSVAYCNSCESVEVCLSAEHPRWNYHGSHYGINTYNFTALPAGYRHDNGNFYSLGSHALFWSSSESGTNASRRFLRYTFSSFGSAGWNRSIALSVRCLKSD